MSICRILAHPSDRCSKKIHIITHDDIELKIWLTNLYIRGITVMIIWDCLCVGTGQNYRIATFAVLQYREAGYEKSVFCYYGYFMLDININ